MKRGLLTSVCVLSGLILSGCGGGGGGELTGAGGAPTITTTPTNVSRTISSIPSQQLASFGDGASAERFVSSDGLLYTGIFDDPLLKSVIENEAYTVSGTPTSGSANGVNFQTISAPQTSDEIVDEQGRQEILEIFPELMTMDYDAAPRAVRPMLTGREGRRLTQRHLQKRKHLAL